MDKSAIQIIFLIFIFNSLLAQRINTKSEFTKSLKLDSRIAMAVDSSVTNAKMKFPPIFAEAAGGAAFGFIGILGGSAAGFVIMGRPTGLGALIIIPFAYAGFVAGSAFGVYLPAYSFNANCSYWLTFLSGIGGAAAGIGIASMPEVKDRWEVFSVFAGPIIFELLYANLLVPNNKFEDQISTASNPSKFSDYYNSTIVFQTELFRINF